jgi:hypothetical protein
MAISFLRPNKTAWTHWQWKEHIDRLERIEAAEGMAMVCLDEADQ